MDTAFLVQWLTPRREQPEQANRRSQAIPVVHGNETTRRLGQLQNGVFRTNRFASIYRFCLRSSHLTGVPEQQLTFLAIPEHKQKSSLKRLIG